MAQFKLYVLIRYPGELIGIYRTEEEAKEAQQDYITSSNEDEFYIDYDFINL